MIIEMNNGKKEDFERFKGGNGKLIATMFFDGTNRIIHGILKQGSSIGIHTHIGNCEIIYILKGKAKFIYDDGEEYACVGQVHYCLENHAHSMMNEEKDDLEFFAVVPEKVGNK